MDDIQYLTIEHVSAKDLARIFSRIIIDLTISYKGIPCWTVKTNDVYGKVYFLRNRYKAHRFFYAWLVAPLPIGREYGEIDHLCRNKRCVNPVHLELVSSRVNCLRSESPTAKNAKKTHCINGHLLPTEVNYRNERVCETCARQRVEKFAECSPDRYNKIRDAATKRYVERHPERRKETYRKSYLKRAAAGYYQQRRASQKMKQES